VRQALLDGRFDLPQVGRLSDKPCAVAQGGKERAIMGAEVLPNIGIVSKLVQKLGGKLTLFQGISQVLSHYRTT
jgi:hypothetical protein